MITVKKELFHGTPNDERTEKERLTYEALNKLGIDFYRADHDAAATIEDCKAVEKVLGSEICKNLLLCNRQETVFYLLLMPGNKPFKTKDISKQINSARLSFASAEKMLELVNITPGSLSVTGLIFDTENKVNLLIDRDLLTGEYLCCHPCVNTSTLKIKTLDIIEKFIPSTGHTPVYVDLPRYEDEEWKED
ncbi:MAG: prolyl-tRNA synthetase associated domain-containing protein [Clostridia bacterium]|nr:prolyl-tRNA synthetase associated domain-containing protein [Clostridia bacterium]